MAHPPAGWPMHRTNAGDPCEPRGPKDAAWGYYNPSCQSRWKGVCHDDARGKNVRKTCALDYFDHQVRLTYVWNSLNDRRRLDIASQRLRRLASLSIDAPDAVFVATGLWDLEFAARSKFCPRLHNALLMLQTTLPSSQIAIMGFAPCPTCSKKAMMCGHWPHRISAERLQDANACAANASIQVNATVLDIRDLTRTLPFMPSSPCGSLHLFGAGSEAVVNEFLGVQNSRTLLRSHSPSMPSLSVISMLERFWTPGTYKAFSSNASTQ